MTSVLESIDRAHHQDPGTHSQLGSVVKMGQFHLVPELESNLRAGIYVIGKRDQLRSNSLQFWLDQVSAHIDVTFVDPVFPDPSLVDLMNRLVKFHYSTPMSAGEAGCSIAHLHAQLKALEDDVDAAIFLEDDAITKSGLADEVASLALECASSPLPKGISLYAGVLRNDFLDSSRSSNSSGFLYMKRGVFPSFTVAYILNRKALFEVSAMTHASGLVPIGKADYPLWAQRVEWLVPLENLVDHDVENSTISERVPQTKASKLHQASILLKRFLAAALLPKEVPLKDRAKWEFAEFYYATVSKISNSKTL